MGLTANTSVGASNGKPSATIAPTPDGCAPETKTSVSSVSSQFVIAPGEIICGDPGTTHNISMARGYTCSGSVSGSQSVDVSATLVSAQIGISGSISFSKTATVQLGGPWTVPSDQSLGWLTLCSERYTMHWTTSENWSGLQGQYRWVGLSVSPCTVACSWVLLMKGEN
jgi:hypothetical protein